MPSNAPFLFAGLGNPGPEYEDTRHNAGFWWVDALAAQLRASWQPERGFHGWVARGALGGHTVWLLKPATFMNASGKAVAALARFYKVPVEHTVVAYDELDIAPGEAKFKRGGSSTHNGLRDTTAQLGTPDYWRLKLGIGHPGSKPEVIGWVLQKPRAAEREAIAACIARTLAAAEPIVAGDLEKATQLIHTSKPPRPKPPRPPLPVAPPTAP